MGAIAFSFQIYGDFSGYSDIALGTAKLFGFELLSNFKFPYFSRNVAEFWRRWHISLSSWFRDYLYIPLGGSKSGKVKAVRNTFIIFLVSGFWHGASWNFIVWGGLHACAFLPLLLFNKNRQYVGQVVAENQVLPSLKALWQMTSTFVFVCLAWIFFRADNLAQAWAFIVRLFDWTQWQSSNNTLSNSGLWVLFDIVVLVCCDWYLRHNERQLKTPQSKALRYSLYLLLAFFILIHFHDQARFIYFQF
jgi:D-alanyl-lipoteichoic acid acyltransferase DltB (MBOAT superfamily)